MREIAEKNNPQGIGFNLLLQRGVTQKEAARPSRPFPLAKRRAARREARQLPSAGGRTRSA